MATRLDSRQTVNRSALSMIGSSANESLDSILAKVDPEIAKLYEDRNALLTDGGLITFSASQLQFTEDLKLHLNSKIAGGAPVVINLGNATATFSASGRMLYAVIDRGAGTAVVTADATTLPAVTSANKEVFLIAKRVDTGGSLQRVYFRNGMALDDGQTARLGASGSGGSGSSLVNEPHVLRALVESENNKYDIPQPDLILDTFKQSRASATYTDVVLGDSDLRLAPTETTGTYERSRETTTEVTNANGVAIMRIQAFAPKNTAIVSNTIIFHGDLTSFFPTSQRVMVFKELTTDDQLSHIHLVNADNTVARLSVSSSTYSSGPNETTIVLSNPGSLDLTMGLLSSQYNSTLRVCPADIDFKAKASTAASFETFNIDNAHIINVVGFTADSAQFTIPAGSIAGSINWSDAYISNNGQYAVIAALEETTGNSLWHFWYSLNGGAANSWVKFSATISHGSNEVDNGVSLGSSYRFNRAKLAVADNGKVIVLYTKVHPGSQIGIYGYYANLTDVTPALTDIPALGSNDAGNSQGATAGTVFASDSLEYTGVIGFDKTNLSVFAVSGEAVNSSLTAYVRFYDFSGSTPSHVGLSPTAFSVLRQSVRSIEVSGTSPNHRFTLIYCDQSTGYITLRYWDEGSTTEVATSTLLSEDSRLMDIASSGDKIYIFYRKNTSPSGAPAYISGVLSTQTYSAENKFINSANQPLTDTFGGMGTAPSAEGDYYFKNFRQRILIDPNNEDHVLMFMDMVHPASSSSKVVSTMFEVTDDTDFLGSFVDVAHNSNVVNFRDTTAREEIAQVITGSVGQRIKTVKFKTYRVGTVAANAEIYAEIQAVTGGAPNGTVLDTSLNTIRVADISTDSSDAQYIYFNFDNFTLAASQYAIVLKSTNFTVSASNYLVFLTNTSDPYAGGNLHTYNGSSWSDAGYDLALSVIGEYVYEFGNSVASDVNDPIDLAQGLKNMEASVHKINSTTARVAYKETFHEASNGRLLLSGRIKSSVVTLSAGASMSTFTAFQIAGFKSTDVDENLVLMASLGDSDTEGLDVTDGSSDSLPAQDRSGLGHKTVVSGVVAGDFVADVDFDSGFCLENPGTTSGVAWNDGGHAANMINKPFIIEVEAKIDSLAAVNYLLVKHQAGSSNGWLFTVETSGKLQFLLSGPNVASTSTEVFSTNTYYRFRAVGDGSSVRLYYATSGFSFTECTYDNQITGGYTAVANAFPVTAGTVPLGAGQPLLRLGEIKIAIDSDTFVYNGYKNQAPLGELRLLGSRLVVEKRIGHFDETTGASTSQFDTMRVVDFNINQESKVNSYDQLWMFKKTLSTAGKKPYLQIVMNRSSDNNQNSVRGVAVQYNK